MLMALFELFDTPPLSVRLLTGLKVSFGFIMGSKSKVLTSEILRSRFELGLKVFLCSPTVAGGEMCLTSLRTALIGGALFRTVGGGNEFLLLNLLVLLVVGLLWLVDLGAEVRLFGGVTDLGAGGGLGGGLLSLWSVMFLKFANLSKLLFPWLLFRTGSRNVSLNEL